MRRSAVLISGNLRSITRDSMLVLILCAPIIILGMIRFGIPLLSRLLLTQLSFDLSVYYPLIFIFFCGILPLLFGMIIGFVMLDEQDEHIMQFVAVTPLARKGYLWIKFTLPSIAIFIFSLAYVPLSGIVSVNILHFLPIAALFTVQAPLMGMFLVGFANNKVEGLALGKGAGIFIMAPIVGYFVHSPLQYLAGISPAFWTAEAYFASNFESYLLNVLIGIVIHAIFFYGLYRKFTHKILHF